MEVDTQFEKTYDVVVNDGGQYSIWSIMLELPLGWKKAGFVGNESACLDYVTREWRGLAEKA